MSLNIIILKFFYKCEWFSITQITRRCAKKNFDVYTMRAAVLKILRNVLGENGYGYTLHNDQKVIARNTQNDFT